jgi:hypothetical protein
MNEAQQANALALNKSLRLDSGGLMMGDSVVGGLTNETFSRLQKALVASPSTPGGPGDGSSLIPQSLARTLKNVTFKLNKVKLWRAIAKQDAYAMEEEYDQITQYGSRGGVFTSAMATPQGNDSTFDRLQVRMTYMATAYATDIAIMATEVIGGSAEALQINNATRYLLGGVERQLFYADSSLVPSAFNGVKTIIKGFAQSNGFTNVIINAGATGLSVEHLENSMQAIQDNSGDPENGLYAVYFAPRVQSYFTKTYAPAQRTEINQAQLIRDGRLWVGTPVDGYNSTYGPLQMVNDIFLNYDVPVATVIQGAPSTILGTPTAALNTTSAEDPNIGTSMWITPNGAEDYGVGYNGGPVTYAIEAVNAAGPSLLSSPTTSVTVGSDESVTVTWNRVTSSPQANYYQIYRAMNGGVWQPVARIADSGGSSATQSWTDENITVAGAYDAFIINHDAEEGLVFKQLLPFFKWPLPIPALARYFAVALLGAPLIYVPSRCAVIENIQIPGGIPAPVQLS